MASDRAQILITAIDQTRQAFASAKSNLEGLSSAASKVNSLLTGLGAALSVAGLLAAGKHALETADNLAKLSQKTGMSVESLSLLRPIAEQSGVSLEGLAKGIKKLSSAMVEAAGGSKEQADTFLRLGVSVKDTAGQLRPTEEVLLDLASAFAAMPDGAEKSALAVKLFGKSGVDLIPFLNQGRTGIEELKTKFKELGLEVNDKTARAAEKFNDTLNTVKQALQGIAMKVAEAALPALQHLADALVALASHGDAIMNVVRLLGEVLVAFLAVKGVAAVAKLLEAVSLLKLAFTRFLPIMAAVALWEMGRGIVNWVQEIRSSNRALDELNRQRDQVLGLSRAMAELAGTGTISVKTQMELAAQAAERLKAGLPGTSEALRAIQGAASDAGEAIRHALDAEIKKAAETVKQLSASYKQVAGDIKAIWDARVADIEANYKRQEAAAQNSTRSEYSRIRDATQILLTSEQEKLTAVRAGAQQMEEAWRATYAQAVALARAAGQDAKAVEREAIEARISIYGQLESAYRGTIDRLIAEEQRHLAAAKAADEARLNLRLATEDRIRELARKGMDELSAYQDRQRQVDEKQAQARAALATGNFEQARKLAEDSIALAERSASAVTRQVEQNGKTVTQTVVSEASAAANAIGQIRESAGIADAALKGLSSAHKQAAAAAGEGADVAKRALAEVSVELDKLRQRMLSQDTLKLNVDIEAAKAGIDKISALTESMQLVARIQADTKAAQDSLDKLKSDTGNLELTAQVNADTSRVIADIDHLKTSLSNAGIPIPALVSFDQPRRELQAFATDAQLVLGKPTSATHTPEPNLAFYRQALAELMRPTSSTHTIYVQQVRTNAQGGLIQKFAAGGRALMAGFKPMTGRIFGPGTETSDSVPALLSHGEFVMRAASVRKFGEGFFAALNAGFLPAMPKFALGGMVSNFAMTAGAPIAPARDVVDLRFHVGSKSHTLQSSRDTAMALASALRELSRAA